MKTISKKSNQTPIDALEKQLDELQVLRRELGARYGEIATTWIDRKIKQIKVDITNKRIDATAPKR